ncbi:MAG: glycosyltransferase family 2 protein [Candidatus Zixiibacteriota bacterium]
MNKISCVVITCNESTNIRRCLESISWADEIIVVDSYSTDNTREISSEFTDKIFELKWEGFGPAKEHARKLASGKWLLSLDADEVVSQKLREEIQGIADSEQPLDGYFIPRKSVFLGRWIKHGGWYPDFVLRFFRNDKGKFTARLVHEEVEVCGKCGYMKNDLLHRTDPDFDHYLSKLNRYTTIDATQLLKEGKKAGLPDILLRPAVTFFKMYFFKRGFLDGLPGVILAVSSAFHVFSKYVKLWHLYQPKGEEGSPERVSRSLQESTLQKG